MYMKNVLGTGRSKGKVKEILEYIGADADRLAELMDLVLGEDKALSIYSSWVLYHALDVEALDFTPYTDLCIGPMIRPSHPMMERGLLKLFRVIDHWPEEQFSEIVDHMMATIMNTSSKIAAQALSMEALWKHLQPYPELIEELMIVIEEGMPYGSAGYKAKARKILKEGRR